MKYRKDELEHLINIEHLTYSEIGKRYSVSSAAIRKAAQRLGIVLPKRRKVNASETFNKGNTSFPTLNCLNCGKEFVKYPSHKGLFCSIGCKNQYEHNKFIIEWKEGRNETNSFILSQHIRKYLFDKCNGKCQICGWGEVNESTGKIPLQVHHIDGNCLNNSEDNLQLLCPNCHSLTSNYGSRNKNSNKERTKYFKKN